VLGRTGYPWWLLFNHQSDTGSGDITNLYNATGYTFNGTEWTTKLIKIDNEMSSSLAMTLLCDLPTSVRPNWCYSRVQGFRTWICFDSAGSFRDTDTLFQLHHKLHCLTRCGGKHECTRKSAWGEHQSQLGKKYLQPWRLLEHRVPSRKVLLGYEPTMAHGWCWLDY